jgi:hypothetical protein
VGPSGPHGPTAKAHGRTDGSDGWTHISARQTDGQTDGRMDGWTDRTDGGPDESDTRTNRTDGRTDRIGSDWIGSDRIGSVIRPDTPLPVFEADKPQEMSTTSLVALATEIVFRAKAGSVFGQMKCVCRLQVLELTREVNHPWYREASRKAYVLENAFTQLGISG